MNYKARTNIFTSDKRYFAGDVITSAEFAKLHPIAKTRFTAIEEDISLQPGPSEEASSKADDEYPSADEFVTNNPDRQYLNKKKSKKANS